MTSRVLISMLALAVHLHCGFATADTRVPAMEKKLIEYGWDVPFPDFIAGHIREMEQRPFDGLIFQLKGGGKVLETAPMDEAKFADDFKILPTIQWQKFTDNFVIMWAASDQDWFNDAQWDVIQSNVKLVSKCARLAKCVGVCFDAEPYGTNPWSYREAAHHDTKSFAEYEVIAKKRGEQFIKAVEAELPNPKILTFYLLGLFNQYCKPMPAAERDAKLSTHSYALAPAFIAGMLSGAGPETRITDGNENAYYYQDSLSYFDAYQLMTQRALYMLDPALWPVYRTHARAGQALYVDQYYALRAQKTLGNYMTPEQQKQWFEHNVYWALYTSDEYVWCYSERMNWWLNATVPATSEEAIRSARKKIAEGASLGFDLAPIIAAAKAREKSESAGRIQPKRLGINLLTPGIPRPAIDGVLDEAAWKDVTPTDAFVAPAAYPAELKAESRAKLLYDSQALYIAFECKEPNAAQIKAAGEKPDDESIYSGDVVEVFVSAPDNEKIQYHFTVNPKGVAWEATHQGEDTDMKYNPTWEKAARIGDGVWTAEMAIPWAALKIDAPKQGTTLRANLTRERAQGPELSVWSGVNLLFLEPENFGTWKLR
ncbi:MAG: carbohydrate-binding family 9-like protein [Candidatus Hydrogenedentes bacterium]|nr:carbohydrate-binding family 9-like protein [Candidatus Hydrogenedentota bacterium]